MSDGLLSQDEINALLNGAPSTQVLSDSDKDLLGEVGNIAMGTASTALSTIIGRAVNITTPRVTVTTLRELKLGFEVPNVALEVLFTEGLNGANLLLIKITDAAIIADLMMGGNGDKEFSELHPLTEIEISAVSEAMNQMIGSAATSLATMLGLPVNISPPVGKVWDDKTKNLSENVDEDENIVRISFKLTIDTIIDSEIMLLLSVETTKTIINKMTGQSDEPAAPQVAADFAIDNTPINSVSSASSSNVHSYSAPEPEEYHERPRQPEPVNVQRAEFAPLTSLSSKEKQNIDLILDVPLEISVVLGRTKKTIKEILSLGTGSLIELDKLTEEPVEVLVNGKRVALGEVVVVDENFGVRITSIVSDKERIKSLQG